MSDVSDHLKAGFHGLSLDEALQLPTSALLGVSDAATLALKRIGVQTLFDLGASWLFANASTAMANATAEPGTSDAHLLEPPAPEDPRDPGLRPLQALRGISDEDAAQITQALGIETIREFALWPPRVVAHALMSQASGAGVDGEDVHAEALRPRLGEYPTERVYYDSLVMLGMAAGSGQEPLTGTISLQPVVDDPAGFGQPAVGALVTLSQSWYAKGITLGHMLHSLALAPGEATRIAVIDWSRRTRASVSESIEEAEALDSASEHSRAISEVQNAVANEMQSGGSMSSGWAKSTSKGKSGGFSIGGGVAGAVSGVTGALGFGGGSASSSQSSETNSEASSSSWSIGNRSVMAEMSQRVNDRTEQHSTSVRNRRASAVREVSQSEHEEVSTRVVANYNHMHALTIQYYEVVQVYRVLVQVHSVQRVLFLPFQLLDFSTDGAADVVSRFRGQLLGAALNQRVVSLLLDDRGAVEIRSAIRVQLPPIFSDVVLASGGTATTLMARSVAGTESTPPAPTPNPPTPPTTTGGGVLTAPGSLTLPVRRITSPGPVLDTVAGDVELVAVSFDGVRVDRVRLDQAGVPADATTFAVPNTTFQVDFPGGMPLRNVTAIHVSKIDADADSGTMTLHYRTATQQLALPVPLDLPAGTAMQKVAFLAADPANRKNELMAHLQANRSYYTQAVLANIDTATLVMLLSRFTWKGKPLVDQVEPKPLAMTGNYLVLRAPVEDDEPSGIDDTAWGTLLSERSLTLAQRDDRLVPIPTGGVFAEAVLGRSNSAEKLDITRFWNWQDSPIPLQPTEIAPISTGSRGSTEDLRPGQLGAPVLNVLNPTSLPEPAGLGAAITALANGSMFRDMSGLAGTQALAQAASSGTLDAATEAGRIASTNLKTVTDQAVAMGQAAADMWKTAQANKPGGGGGGGGGSGGGTGSSVSADGARINHGRDMDQRGVPGAAGSTSGGAAGSGFKVTEQQSEFQAAGGGGSGSGFVAPISRELAFADTAATGVSPSLLAGTTQALNSASTTALASMGAIGLPLVAAKVLDLVLLKVFKDDVNASGMSLQGVTLRPMREHKHGAAYSGIGFMAWTNSATDVYVDVEAYIALVNTAESNGRTTADAELLSRAMMVAVLRHEAIHVAQFKQSGRPQNFKAMLDFERSAYGCTPPAPHPNNTRGWLADTTAAGARHFYVNVMKLSDADATIVITKLKASFDPTCASLDAINTDTATAPNPTALSQAIKDGMISEQLLPESLDQQTVKPYTITEMYKAK